MPVEPRPGHAGRAVTSHRVDRASVERWPDAAECSSRTASNDRPVGVSADGASRETLVEVIEACQALPDHAAASSSSARSAP